MSYPTVIQGHGLWHRATSLILLFLCCSFFSFGAMNNAPVAVDDENYGPEGIEQTGDVSLNDSDPDGDELSYTVVVAPEHGELILNPDGTYNYMPESLYVGFDYATYEACDLNGLCSQATIEFAMTFVNYPPVAEDDAFFAFVDTELSGTIADNDYELNDEPYFFSMLADPQHAAAFTFNTDGTFTYLPEPGFEGEDLFIYRICDPCGACDFAVANIEVVPANPAPIPNDDEISVIEDITYYGDVSTNDADPEGDSLGFELNELPEHGTVSMAPNGTFTFVPEHDYFGADEFTYFACDPYGQCVEATVIVDVIFINDPPVAEDDYFTVTEDGELTGSVSLNDYDVDFEPIEWMIWIQPSNGDVVWNELDGTFTYTPDPNFFGEDQIRYFMLDPCGETDLAYVYITVEGVNDAPVSQDDSASTNEDVSVDGDVSMNDSDIDGPMFMFSVVQEPANGTLLLNQDGTYTYTPNENFNGTDSFIYLLSDNAGGESQSTVQLTIDPVNDLPQAQNDEFSIDEDGGLSNNVSSNDEDIDGDELTFHLLDTTSDGNLTFNADGSFDFIPNENYFGTISLNYEVCDAEECVEAELMIHVNPVNDMPIAENAGFSADEDGVIEASVAAFGSDIEDAELSFDFADLPLEGDFSFNTDGSFSYTPAPDEFGVWELTFFACDSDEACAEASLTLEIFAVNDAPFASDDEFSIDEDNTLTGDVSLNDGDIDSENLTFTVISGAVNGDLELMSNGQFNYEPDQDFFGAEIILYQICDDHDECVTAEIILNIDAVNDAPTASNDSFGVLMNESLSGSVAGNDSDVDSEELTFNLLSPAQNGDLNFNSDGSFTYMPDLDFTGMESLTYEVCDGEFCSEASLSIDVVNTNEPPVTADDEYSMDEDTQLEVNIAQNDTDPNEDELVYTLAGQPLNGTAAISASGILTFTPNEDFYGEITFEYTACDQFNECDNAWVTITIANVNDAPVASDDNFVTNEDEMISGTVGNDTDADGDELSYSLIGTTESGTILFNVDGSFEYTPDLNNTDEVVLEYEVCDGNGMCDSAFLTISVIEVNDAPVAENDAYSTSYLNELSGDVSLNDYDVEGEGTYSLIDTPDNGVISFNSDGTFIFTPENEFTGEVSLTYSFCDAEELCAQAELIITVTTPNFAPVVMEFNDEICESVEYELDLNSILSDDQTPVESLQIVQLQVSEGTHELVGHTLYYTPSTEGAQTVTVTLTVCDLGQDSECAEGSFTLDLIDAIEVELINSTITPALCFGDANGSIELEVSSVEEVLVVWDNEQQGTSLENLAAGEYTASISTMAACTQTIEQSFTVTGPSEAISVTGLEALPINDTPGGSSEFEVNGGTEPYSFAWYNANDELISEDQYLNGLGDAELAGEYYVIITDANDCSIQESIMVTDINDLSLAGIKVYPNPVSDNLSIDLGSSAVLSLEVYDSRGRRVISESVNGRTLIQLNTVTLENGYYFLQLTGKDSSRSLPFIKN